MELLQPQTGLLFWMMLAFGVVFFLVARFGFPVIIRAIDSRREYVDSSLSAAREARQQLAAIESEKHRILKETETERTNILRTASEERERIMAEARAQAAGERTRLVAEAQAEAALEREAILRDARQQVALLAVSITEKMLRRELPDKASQTALAGQLLDEIGNHKNEMTWTPD